MSDVDSLLGIGVPQTGKSPAQPADRGEHPAARLSRRYADAFAVARGIVGLGSTVKVVAVVIGLLIVLAGLVISGQANSGAAGTALGGIVLAIAVGVPLFVLGVLVSAVGQILRATLDTAVNTSPLLTQDHVAHVLSVD